MAMPKTAVLPITLCPTLKFVEACRNIQFDDNSMENNHLLEEEMIEYESYVNDMVDVELNQSQFDSLCAWVYNLGPSNFGSSTLLKVLNEGKYDEVPAQIKRWNKAGGEVLNGLIRRREAEALLFQGKEWHEV